MHASFTFPHTPSSHTHYNPCHSSPQAIWQGNNHCVACPADSTPMPHSSGTYPCHYNQTTTGAAPPAPLSHKPCGTLSHSK